MKRFVKINDAEYSNDFDFFVHHQVCVIHHLDNTTSICSRLENRCFKSEKTPLFTSTAILDTIRQIHLNVISLKYGGELII